MHAGTVCMREGAHLIAKSVHACMGMVGGVVVGGAEAFGLGGSRRSKSIRAAWRKALGGRKSINSGASSTSHVEFGM